MNSKNTLSFLSAIKISFVIALSVFVFACNDEKPKVEMTSAPAAAHSDSATAKFTVAMVDNKKDPSCGMPVTAGIADTVHYGGKVYGFCSDECKQAFLKNPTEMAKVAELK